MTTNKIPETVEELRQMAQKSGNRFKPTDSRVICDLKRLQKNYLKAVKKSNVPSKTQTFKNNFFRFMQILKRRGLSYGIRI
jgi:hypothetical protein